MTSVRVSQLERMERGYMRDDNLLLIVDTEENVSKCVTLGDIRDYAKRGPLGYGPLKPFKRYFEDVQKESLWMRIKRLFNWI